MAAQAGLCLAWSGTTEDTFCRVAAHLFIITIMQICFCIDINWFKRFVHINDFHFITVALNHKNFGSTLVFPFTALSIRTHIINAHIPSFCFRTLNRLEMNKNKPIPKRRLDPRLIHDIDI